MCEYDNQRLRHNDQEKCQNLDFAGEKTSCKILDAIFRQRESHNLFLSNTLEEAFPWCSFQLGSQMKSGQIQAHIERHNDQLGTGHGMECI